MAIVPHNPESGKQFSTADPALSRDIDRLIGRTWAPINYAEAESAIANALRWSVDRLRSYGTPGYVKSDRADIAIRLLENLNFWADKLALIETRDGGSQMQPNARILELIAELQPFGFAIACAVDRNGKRFHPFYRLCRDTELEWTTPQDGKKPRRKPFMFGTSPKATKPAKAGAVPAAVNPDPPVTLRGIQTGLFGYQPEEWRDPDFGGRAR